MFVCLFGEGARSIVPSLLTPVAQKFEFCIKFIFGLTSHLTVLIKVSLPLCFGKGDHVLKRAVAHRGRQLQVLLLTFF